MKHKGHETDETWYLFYFCWPKNPITTRHNYGDTRRCRRLNDTLMVIPERQSTLQLRRPRRNAPNEACTASTTTSIRRRRPTSPNEPKDLRLMRLPEVKGVFVFLFVFLWCSFLHFSLALYSNGSTPAGFVFHRNANEGRSSAPRPSRLLHVS